MIPEEVLYYPNTGSSVQIGSTTYPLKSFNMTTTHSNSPINRAQAPGEFPSYSYPRSREFFFAGDILGSSASDYNTKLKTFKTAIQPTYSLYSSRRHGYLRFKFYGDAGYYYSNVILTSLETPKEANYPSVGTYEIQFHSFDPYLKTGGPNTRTFSNAF